MTIKRNRKTYTWKTERGFTTMFIKDLHEIIEYLWDLLYHFSSRVVQAVDQHFPNFITHIVRDIPDEVLHVIFELRRLVEKSRVVEEAIELTGRGNGPIAYINRLVHIEKSKEEMRKSCRRFQGNCTLLHECCLSRQRGFCSWTKVNEFCD